MRNTHARVSSPRVVKFLGVGPRQIRVIASDATQDRMGDVLEPAGVRLAEYRRNPVVLAQHDANQPIARCASIGLESNQVVALIEFPAEGISARADEYLRLMKAGIVSAVSVGFVPHSWEPIRGAGLRFTDWSLLELSCVSVPANPSALVTERSMRRRGTMRRSDDADEADDDGPFLGNCGRPVGLACGMADKSECSIHGQGQVGLGAEEEDKTIDLQLVRRARAMRRRLDGPARSTLADDVLTRDEVAQRVRELRGAYGLKPKPDPRAIAAEAQFRLRNY